MKVFFASDHAGYELKNQLAEFAAKDLGHEVVDCGPFTLNPEDDYPDFITVAVANLKEASPDAKAVILGKTGQGEAMVANRFAGIRAVVYYGNEAEIIPLSRQHNDANVLSLGAGFIDSEEAKQVLEQWLNTPFSGEVRHQRRIAKIDGQYE